MWFLESCAAHSHVCIEDIFTEEELDRIVKTGLTLPHRKAQIIGQNNDLKILGEEDTSIRNVNEYNLGISDETRWIYEKISRIINDVNTKIFSFDLTWFEPLQMLRYESEEKSCYRIHADAPYDVNHIIALRKLSLILQLSNDDDYCGGDVKIHLNTMHPEPTHHVMPKKRGTIILFPSTMLHEVTPITSGKRISLVTWVYGPKFK